MPLLGQLPENVQNCGSRRLDPGRRGQDERAWQPAFVSQHTPSPPHRPAAGFPQASFLLYLYVLRGRKRENEERASDMTAAISDGCLTAQMPPVGRPRAGVQEHSVGPLHGWQAPRPGSPHHCFSEPAPAGGRRLEPELGEPRQLLCLPRVPAPRGPHGTASHSPALWRC